MELYTNDCLYKDVYTIIEMMSPELRNKINNKFIEFLKENQNKNFKGTVDKNVPIRNQNLREEIKIMLSMIYIDYFCSEEKRKEILSTEENNINKFYNKPLFNNGSNIFADVSLSRPVTSLKATVTA